MNEIELAAGRFEYEDTGGPGPVIVLIHGLLMDSTLWTGVLPELSTGYRCLAPTLPMGAHRHPTKPDADLSLPGLARLATEFLDRLDLRDVTLVGNDTGGALVQLMMAGGSDRISRAVLISCEAFDNFPPGLTGRTLALAARLSPRAFGMFMQQMRLRMVRRLPIAFGWLTKRGDATTAKWMKPILTQPDIRRDTVRMLRAVMADKKLLVRTADRLADFDRPTLVVWAEEDRVMPPEHGRRLTQLLPHAQLIVIADSYTLVPLDQPARLGQVIKEFSHAAEGTRPAAG
ncbi:MAG: alpha/beta hydrolase [Pseudonocardiales bacterium]|nr:alpha/beta hydrolase [Pseudonocardiales bacterium]